MSEREHLTELNEGLKRVEHTLNKLNSAVLGDEYNTNGILPRLTEVEKKQKRIDNFFYILLGAITLGTYPLVSPFVKEWFKL